MQNKVQFDQQHIWHPYQSSPSKYPQHLIKSANGVYLKLANNKLVIDGMSAWWAAIHGYNNALLNQALTDQLKQMAHIMFGGLTHASAIDLATKLIALTPLKLTQVFFSDSGSVAVEVALKMALQYQQAQGKTAKNKFITPLGGYHGDTFGAMAVCDYKNGMHHLFSGMLARHFFVAQPNAKNAIDNLATTIKNNHHHIATMILEPLVQGAGGMHFYDANYLKAARELCSSYDVLLIIDEIATGFGRTGKLFASEWANVQADILCLGKALTGGYLSLGATLTSEKIATTIGTLMHGPTFMANPLACAVASASIELLLNSNWQKNINRIQKRFENALLPLKEHKKIDDVRIFGAIAAVQMCDSINIQNMQDKLLSHGVWLRPFAKLLYTMPPFIINDEQLQQLNNAIITSI